ncbi:MAG: rhomboid family intramembrane serine protease, partial [Chloroflexota bacterium]
SGAQQMTTAGTIPDLKQFDDLIMRGRGNEVLRLLAAGRDKGDSPETQALRAWALADRAEFEKAARTAAAVVASDPTQARAHLALGLCARAAGNAQAAADAFAQAIQADSSFAPAYYQFGLLFLKSGDAETARRALTTARSLDPEQWRYAAALAQFEPGPGRTAALRSAYRAGIAAGDGMLGLRLRLLGTYLGTTLLTPGGAGSPAATRLAAAAYQRLLARPVIVVYMLLAINVAMYVFLETHGGSQNGVTLERYGAKDDFAIIHQGQWWRLITPIFLHEGLLHLGVNCFSLYMVGPLYERCVGSARFLYVYFFAGICGSLFSLAASPDPGVGASGAIFGVFGGLGVYFFRNRRLFGRLSRSLVGQVAVLSAINLLIPNVVGGIDGWAHAGGLLGGMAAAWLVGPAINAPGANAVDVDLDEQRPPSLVAIVTGAAAVVLAALAVGVITWNPVGA